MFIQLQGMSFPSPTSLKRSCHAGIMGRMNRMSKSVFPHRSSRRAAVANALAESVRDLVSVETPSEPTGKPPLVITPGRMSSRPPFSPFSLASAEAGTVFGRSLGAESIWVCFGAARSDFVVFDHLGKRFFGICAVVEYSIYRNDVNSMKS